MNNEMISNQNFFHEQAVTERFLTTLDEKSFADLFEIFAPQLVSFYRARGCELFAEDLAQEVMFTVYRKAEQIRDHSLFRAWLFKVARNAMCRHYGKKSREVDTVDLMDVADTLAGASHKQAATPAFEFHRWMGFLETREREVMKLRFIDEWEYHEIAEKQAIPIGTVQWRVFNAKKKLAPHLKRTEAAIPPKAA